MTKRLPDARTTIANVKRGVLDESYLAVSPFDIDEGQVRRQLKQRAATNGKGAAGPRSAKAGSSGAGKRR